MAKVTFDDELDATMRELEADKNSMFMNLKHYHRDENLEIKMLRREQIYPNPINEPIYARCDGGTDKVPL